MSGDWFRQRPMAALRRNPKNETMRALSIILALIFASAAPAQELHWSGYVKFFAYPNLNPPYLLDRYGTRVQLALSHSVSERANFYAAVNVNLEENRTTGLASEPRSAITEIYPVEVYIDLHWENVDLRLGKQFIFWGRADWVNPTDNITPWDFVNITAELEDYRLPVSALRLDMFPGNWNLQFVLVPFFKPNRIPMRFPDSLGGLPVLQPPADLPDSRLKNWQFGLKADSYLAGFDFSLSYWQGFDLFPSLYVSARIPEGGLFPDALMFQQRFHRVRVLGADFSRSFDRLAIKGEAAYFRTDDRTGDNIFIKNAHLRYVVGIDYNFSDRLSANLQFVQEILFDYSADRERRLRQAAGDPSPDVADRITNSASTRLHYSPSDFWDLQLIGVFNFADRDVFLLPIINYSFADGLNIYAGATLFRGPANSPFGRNKKYSRAFFEVKYSF